MQVIGPKTPWKTHRTNNLRKKNVKKVLQQKEASTRSRPVPRTRAFLFLTLFVFLHAVASAFSSQFSCGRSPPPPPQDDRALPAVYHCKAARVHPAVGILEQFFRGWTGRRAQAPRRACQAQARLPSPAAPAPCAGYPRLSPVAEQGVGAHGDGRCRGTRMRFSGSSPVAPASRGGGDVDGDGSVQKECAPVFNGSPAAGVRAVSAACAASASGGPTGCAQCGAAADAGSGGGCGCAYCQGTRLRRQRRTACTWAPRGGGEPWAGQSLRAQPAKQPLGAACTRRRRGDGGCTRWRK